MRAQKVNNRSILPTPPSRGNMKVYGEHELPRYTNDGRIKFALIQTGSYGDNVNSTLMFKPLKTAHPNAILDIYTSTNYEAPFYHNHLINKLISFKSNSKESALNLHYVIPPLLEGCGYDHIIVAHPMINKNWGCHQHPELGENLINAWVNTLESLSIPYNLPLETMLTLSEGEIENARAFCRRVKMAGKRNVLMEIESLSGQSFWGPAWTIAVGKHLLDGNTNLFISMGHRRGDINALYEISPSCVHFVGRLSVRECAELFNHCDVFFSCSSGLSNACNTNWCKKTGKWVEVVNGNGNGDSAVSSAPIRREGKIFWYENDIQKFIAMLKDNGL